MVFRTEPSRLTGRAFQVALVVKNPSADVAGIRGVNSMSGLRRSSGEGHGNPLQYSCLENPQGRTSLECYNP